MPKELEKKLRIEVAKKHAGWSKERKNAYIFGVLRKTGWVPSTQKKEIMEESVSCECGCGMVFPKYDNRNRIRRFISGHNAKGKFKERIILNCDCCGKEIKRLKCQMNYPHYFCSNSCRAKWTGQNTDQTLDYKNKLRQITLKNGNKPPLHLGKDHWNWKGGITPQNRIERSNQFYAEWKRGVFRKDNYTCQVCGIRGGRLSAHHKKKWAEYPELRYDIENGQCLCYDCHMELHGLKKKTA